MLIETLLTPSCKHTRDGLNVKHTVCLLHIAGIDAVIYSRTILSLLQQDEPEPLSLSPPSFGAAHRLTVSDCAAVAGARNKTRMKKV